jgi:hypothetical protein
MSKGIAGQVESNTSGGGSAVSDRVSASVDVGESADEHGSRGQRRRRRRNHHHHRNLQKRTGKGFEFAFVTLLAIAILFWILYALLPRAEKHGPGGDESHLAPPFRLSVVTLIG